MFTSFNSVAFYTAHSLEEQGALRTLLEENGIDHSVSALDSRTAGIMFPVLSPELLTSPFVTFTFYVYKKDAPAAAALMDEKWQWEEQEEDFNED